MILWKRSLLKESHRVESLEGEWTSNSEILDSVCSCIDPIDKHRVKLTAEKKNKFLTSLCVSVEIPRDSAPGITGHWYSRMS